jgi:integrase
MLLLTGVRKSNLYSARWTDVSFELSQWTIPASESKSGKEIVVPLTPSAVEILRKRYGNGSQWVFPSQQGSEPGHVTDYKKQWRRLLARAKVDGLTMHDCRRSVGSYMSIANQSLQLVGAALGHQSEESTKIYARLNNETVRRSMLAGEQMRERMKRAAKKRTKIAGRKQKLLTAGKRG